MNKLTLLGSNPKTLPWLTLAAIICLQSINGTNTSFPAYSGELKSRLRISQIQLNILAAASDVGKLFGWCSGLGAARLPLWLVLAIGAAIGSVGYGLQYLFLVHKITQLAYWHVSLLNVLAGNSICWINTACYIAAMRAFPADYGAVVSLATSYAALSAKTYIALAQLILGAEPSDKSIYLLLNSAVPLTVCAIAAPFLREPDPLAASAGAKRTRGGLVAVFVIAGATGVYAVVETAVPVFGKLPRRLPPGILLVMVASIALVPLWKGIMLAMRRKGGEEEEEEEEGERGDQGRCGGGEREGRVLVGECGVRGMVRRVEFWVYFGTYLCGGALGMVYASNLGQVAQSRGASAAALVSTSSAFGFFGKLASAPASAYARKKYMLSRPGSVALLMMLMACSFFLLLSPSEHSLFAGTAIIGMCTGAITSLAVAITSDLFGFEHFGVNHNVVVANIPIGSFIFGYIAAIIYDKEGDHHGGDRDGVCVGVKCYQRTFVIWGSFCSLGTVLSFVLYFRTRRCSQSTMSSTKVTGCQV